MVSKSNESLNPIYRGVHVMILMISIQNSDSSRLFLEIKLWEPDQYFSTAALFIFIHCIPGVSMGLFSGTEPCG